ncbi:MAG TPA: NRDE family protein, partial [Casimicrobiaceae bacterium]|nr:NRDE family protein [Casimicrobiaceae bacterium]
ARDADLLQTGLSLERERLLSAPFIRSADYGTRSSTVLAIGRDGAVQFIERAFDAAGESEGDVEFRFTTEHPLVSAAQD